MKSMRTLDSVSRWILLAGLMLPMVAQAATVTGTVTDKTTGRPDTQDFVDLLSLSQGMQEVSSTKPDAQGKFSITLPDNNMHVLRVTHEQATYYALVQPGATHVDVAVYDVAKKVPGVKTGVDILRMETDSQGLQVIENFFVENGSKPPMTQFGPKAYPIYIPANAEIEGAQAESSDGMPVSVTPKRLDDKGHYAFVFPVRPGETRFGISYLIPYGGSFTFHPQVSLPTANLAVILPNSMSFQSPGASGFEQIQDPKLQAQTFVSKNVMPGAQLAFTVSGTGSMPRELQAQSGNQSQADAGTTQSGRPGGGLGPPIDTPGPLHKYRWWILSALGLVFVIVAAFLLGGHKNSDHSADMEPEESPLTPTVIPTISDSSGENNLAALLPEAVIHPEVGTTPLPSRNGGRADDSLLQGLKEELFALETERAEGKLTEEQYAEMKHAFGVVLRRALSRKS